MNKDKLKIIGLNGSLRKKSYNGAALRFAQKICQIIQSLKY
jgi:NAD(P)H-dependent FMN reductase